MHYGLLDESGPGVTGTHAIRADLAIGVIERSTLGHLDNAGFRRAVNAVMFPADETHGRGRIYDRSAAGAKHRDDPVLHAIENALQIDRLDVVEIFVGLFMQRHHGSTEAGVIAEDVEPSEGLLGRLDHVLHLRAVRDVDVDANRRTADAGGNVAFLAAAIGAYHFRAFADEHLGHRFADA